jgi:hypothetical protein
VHGRSLLLEGGLPQARASNETTLFTKVPGSSGFCEVHQPQDLQLSHNTRRDRSLPFWGPWPIGVGLCRSSSPIHCGPVTMPPGKEPQRESFPPLWATHEEEDQDEP